MYSFIEIEIIFKNCLSLDELNRVNEAFASVIEDRDISNLKIFFIRKKRRLRLREIENT
jgi:uncharacterized protein YjbK